MPAPSHPPSIERDSAAIRRWVTEARASGRRVGFVPTMGALHRGHLSLVESAANDCHDVVVSIFVNPTQFGPDEDFQRYPRSLEDDSRLLSTQPVRWIFAPETEAIYPYGDVTRVSVGGPSLRWEGERRPGHFQGVATVLCKLFWMVPADVVYFGAKDWQQTVVVKRMVRDLAVPIEVVICPTIRELDGLAMSSRNVYLASEERRRATALFEGLTAAKACWHAGGTAEEASRRLQEPLERAAIDIDYAAVVDPDSLEPLEAAAREVAAIAVVAGRVGATRLIDNMLLA